MADSTSPRKNCLTLPGRIRTMGSPSSRCTTPPVLHLGSIALKRREGVGTEQEKRSTAVWKIQPESESKDPTRQNASSLQLSCVLLLPAQLAGTRNPEITFSYNSNCLRSEVARRLLPLTGSTSHRRPPGSALSAATNRPLQNDSANASTSTSLLPRPRSLAKLHLVPQCIESKKPGKLQHTDRTYARRNRRPMHYTIHMIRGSGWKSDKDFDLPLPQRDSKGHRTT